MKKVYAIVLYYDKQGTVIYKEINVLFEEKDIANFVASTICEEKKLYYRLKEYIL